MRECVDFECFLYHRVGSFHEFSSSHYAGIVDEYRHVADVLFDGFGDFVHFVALRHVASIGKGFVAHCAYFFSYRFHAVLVQIPQDHCRLALGEFEGHEATDAARRARYENDFSADVFVGKNAQNRCDPAYDGREQCPEKLEKGEEELEHRVHFLLSAAESARADEHVIIV